MVNALLRSGALFLSFAFAVIGMAVGIHALVASDNMKNYIKENASNGVTININTDDVFDSGVVVTVGCGLLALSSLLTFFLPFFRICASTGKLRLLSPFIHFFLAVWILASTIGFDVIARNRKAKVKGYLGDTLLPDSVVEQQTQALGTSSKYWDHDYIRLLAILPWVAFLFGAIAGVVLLRASKDSFSTAMVDDKGVLRVDVREMDGKPSVEKPEMMESV